VLGWWFAFTCGIDRERCAVPKLAHGGWTAALCSLGCSPVLADQAVDDVPALDRAVISMARPD
jgi:hypothetical protein